jgi:hypothetical protein
MPVHQIVRAQLSRGSSFIAMLGPDPHSSTLLQERSMVEHILEVYGASSAIFTFAFLALASRAAEWPYNDWTPTWISERDLRGGNHRREREAIEELAAWESGCARA